MFKTVITPSISDVNPLRYIDFNSVTTWFESARNPIFKLFNPSLELTFKKWNLKILRCDFNYIDDMYYGHDIEIRTYVSKVGKTSFTLHQEAWQNGKLCANGSCTMLHYNHIRKESRVIDENLRETLKCHQISKEELDKKNKNEMKEKNKLKHNEKNN